MRKITKKYYFSVEGETEEYYLKWLQKTINEISERKCNVSFDIKIQKDPLSRAKGLTPLEKTLITHIFDRESEEEYHINEFKKTLDKMKEAEKLGKKIKYQLGYSNFTFELWMILHKKYFYSHLNNRSQYLENINKIYNENFERLEHYKKENNFKKILKQLGIDDVKEAIIRAEKIMKENEKNGYILEEYKGYKFYKENPSLSVWEIIKQILCDAGLI